MRNMGALRRSTHINRYPAVNVHHARRYAASLGVPLNQMLTINFGLAGIPPDAASRALQKLLAQRFAPWLRRSAMNDNLLRPTYVWSLEAPFGTASAHLLMHLPPKLVRSFRERLRGWLEGLARTSVPSRALDIRPIHNQVGAERYILKGIKLEWGPHLAIQPVAQGEVIGKRSGFSRNLGPTARRNGGYRPKRHVV